MHSASPNPQVAHGVRGSAIATCKHFSMCCAAAACPLPAGLLDTAATNAQVAAELKTALAAAQASGGDVATLLVLSAMNKYTGEAPVIEWSGFGADKQHILCKDLGQRVLCMCTLSSHDSATLYSRQQEWNILLCRQEAAGV